MRLNDAGEPEGETRQLSETPSPRGLRIRWEHVFTKETIRRLPHYPPAAYHSLRNPMPAGLSDVFGPVNQTGFDLVTIVFAKELDLLALQARSFAAFLPDDFAGNLLVIVNDLHCGRLVQLIEQEVVPKYGRWHKRVRVVPFHRLARRLDPSNGWIIQQALKLASAKIIDRSFYVVFDAKNHLIAPLTTSHLFAPSGAARQPFQAVPDCMTRHQAACAAYFGSDPAGGSAQFVPMTPFVLHTSTTRELVRRIEKREGCDVSDFFRDTRFMSEFLLYGAYLGRTPERLRELYVDAPAHTITLWKDSGPISAALVAARDERIICFGLHREVVERADARDMARLVRFWRERGLLKEGEHFACLKSRARRRSTLGLASLAVAAVDSTALPRMIPRARLSIVVLVLATIAFALIVAMDLLSRHGAS